jgi:N-acylneuraminate cytidylyltransferase
VYWSLKALQDSSNIDVIFVATDCEEIKQVVNAFGFSKVQVYDRQAQNASDKASTESVMLEFIRTQNFNQNDTFILVQATSPLTQTKDFDNALKILKKEDANSLLTCVKSKRFFWNSNGTSINYDYKNRPRRQDFDGLLMENGAFYINTVGNIVKDKNRLSGKIAIYEMPEYTAVEIDEEDDWQVAQTLMQKYVLTSKKSQKIKLFLSDVDGTLTDAGMYYGNSGEEFKKFNTHDGKGFERLRKAGVKTGLITSENTRIVENRAKKLKVDYVYQGIEHLGKLEIVKQMCKELNISLEEVAYIGDDVNCKELLEHVGIAACPANALKEVTQIQNIILLCKNGGEGVVREFIEFLFEKDYV